MGEEQDQGSDPGTDDVCGIECWGGILKGGGGKGCDKSFVKGRRHMYAPHHAPA